MRRSNREQTPSLSVILLLAAVLTAIPQSLRAEAEQKAATLAAAAKSAADQLGHGSIATAEKRDGRWSFALAGKAHADGRVVPPEKLIYEIGSISKVFTAFLLADAVRADKVGLDDPLSRHLPLEYADPKVAGITLRQLASHTSCLPRLPDNMMFMVNEADPYARYDEKMLFAYLAAVKITAQPPCGVDYSNLGFGILGVVLEKVQGQAWSRLVADKISAPLGLVDTGVELSEEQKTRLAEPFDGDKPAKNWTFQAMAGAGALRSTPADLCRVAEAWLAGEQGPLGRLWPLVAACDVPMPAAGGHIGLALICARRYGRQTLWHDGGTGGYRSKLVVVPQEGRAAIILSSNAQANPDALLTSFWGASDETLAEEIALDPAALDEYLGVYPLDQRAKLTVLKRDGRLVVRLSGQAFSPVSPSARDEFFNGEFKARFVFSRDGQGRVSRLVLHQSGQELPAERSPEPPPLIVFPAPERLREYVGSYDFSAFQAGAKFSIELRDDHLFATLTGQPALPIFAVGDDHFEYDVVEASLRFERNADGKVVKLVLHQNGMKLPAPKL